MYFALAARRKGVRESLEDQTMGMARAVAGLFTENLRDPDGEPVEVVIAGFAAGPLPQDKNPAPRNAQGAFLAE